MKVEGKRTKWPKGKHSICRAIIVDNSPRETIRIVWLALDHGIPRSKIDKKPTKFWLDL